ncbi:MAG: 4-phosphopantetheinyl transferase family protein [Bdellovibrionaceae bacterium]|nr:4-phosphopantetheinyl transferase family protein [Pseudobdellovibrionaceae bacterium]
MHSASVDIQAFATSLMGPDFHIEIVPFQTRSRDPFEKKTKNRFDLRTSLYNFLKDKKNFVFEDALDLRNVPQKIGVPGKDHYSSLSHTDEIGVFVLDSAPVGVDYENRDRIQQKIVERVCTPDELKLSPNFQLLWSIKEASFKAIPFIVQPKAITDLCVKTVSTATSSPINGYDVTQFSAVDTKSPTTHIQGVCISNASVQLAIAKASVTA